MFLSKLSTLKFALDVKLFVSDLSTGRLEAIKILKRVWLIDGKNCQCPSLLNCAAVYDILLSNDSQVLFQHTRGEKLKWPNAITVQKCGNK